MNEPQLPYDPEVDTFGDRILDIDSTSLTYEEAYKNSKYVDRALDLDTGIPIEFTQFVLRKMAVDETDCRSFEAALDPRAREYLLKLIGPQESEERKVHQENLHQNPTSFRGRFVKLYCRKVIANLQNADYEDEYFDKFARVFPFQVRKNVPEYEVDVLDDFDDRFYDEVQSFLDEYFDENVPARETTALLLNNIRHFFSTMPSEYLKTFPRLNDKGVVHFQYLYKEYRKMRRHLINCRRLTPSLEELEHQDFGAMPEKNINEMASLLQSISFRAGPDLYKDVFKKYLFFFVHSLEIKEGPAPIFFIDNMLYQCLKSLHKFRTHRDDINMVEDIAMITLLNYVGCEKEWISRKGYHINSTTLQNIKDYITNFVSDQNNVQFYQKYKTDLFCELSFRVNNTICFDVYYSNNRNKCHRGVRNFLRHLICSVLSPDDAPIETIVSYSAYLGQENRYEIPRNIVESVRNFVRLSIKTDISKVSREPGHNVYLDLLRDRLIISYPFDAVAKWWPLKTTISTATVAFEC